MNSVVGNAGFDFGIGLGIDENDCVSVLDDEVKILARIFRVSFYLDLRLRISEDEFSSRFELISRIALNVASTIRLH